MTYHMPSYRTVTLSGPCVGPLPRSVPSCKQHQATVAASDRCTMFTSPHKISHTLPNDEHHTVVAKARLAETTLRSRFNRRAYKSHATAAVLPVPEPVLGRHDVCGRASGRCRCGGESSSFLKLVDDCSPATVRSPLVLVWLRTGCVACSGCISVLHLAPFESCSSTTRMSRCRM